MISNKITIVAAYLLIYSCGSGQNQDVLIRGRTTVFESRNNVIHLRIDSSWKEINLKAAKDKSYSGLILTNTTDNFLAVEYSKNEDGRTVEGDIIEFNINGDSINKVFDSKTGELVGNLCLSKNDNKLLFTLENDYFNPSDPIGQLNRPLNILIMDFKKREVIKKLDTVGMSMNLWINDAPWLSDENRFIYDFRTDRNIKMYNDTSEERISREPGIYVYNLSLNKHSLLIPGANAGEVSPREDKIAYLKGKGIYVYDVNTQSNELLFSLSTKDKTAQVKWTPDGQYIYFRSYRINNPSSNAFLIRVSDKRKIRVSGISEFD